jgi:protein phosphatase 1D
VEKALQQWANLKLRADNTSAVTLMLDPPGPPRFQVDNTAALDYL